MKFDADAIVKKAMELGAIQKPSELAALLALIYKQKPRTVVEIGTAKGGTLYALCQSAADDACIVSIDLPGGPFGGGYSEQKAKIFLDFKKPKQKLQFLRKDSHLPSTQVALSEIVGKRKIDFLLIDGDHTFAGVKKDWEFYAHMVREGGLIAFHDICHHQFIPECQVELVWAEVKEHFEHYTFIDPTNDSWGGIGVIEYGSPGSLEVGKLESKKIGSSKSGILLHLGNTVPPAPGFVKHDLLETFPWNIAYNAVHICSGPHIIEHIKPWLIVRFFDELWRVMKPDGQVALSTPYAGSVGYWSDPTHCTGFNEKSFFYFDPDHPAYTTYRPKPWRIEKGYPIWQVAGNLEVLMRPRK